MKLNIQNIEAVLFSDKKTHALLPEYRAELDQWRATHRVPGFGPLRRKIALGVLNALTPEQVGRLEEYFREKIDLNPLDARIVQGVEINTGETLLKKPDGYKDFCLTRDEDTVKITFWR